MDGNEILKLYATFFVSENDDFDTARKLDMLKFIEQADESMIEDLYETNEITFPFELFTEEEDPTDQKEDSTLIGEAVILVAETEAMLEGEFLAEDMKNRLKDLLGMETSLKYKITKASGQAKDALEKQLANVQDKIGATRSAISKGAEAAKDAAGDVAKSATKTGVKAVKAGGEALEKGKEMAGDVGEKAVKAGGKAVSAVKDVAGDHPGVAAAAAAAAALTAGVMAYRKFFSKAAKACSGAQDKKACMAQYKMKAKQAQISTLNAAKSKCAKSKKPDACKAKIDAKIGSLKAKMRG